jgi:hypothetical protein
MTTLQERLRKNPEMAQLIEKQLTHLRIEQQMVDAFAPSVSAVLPPSDFLPQFLTQFGRSEGLGLPDAAFFRSGWPPCGVAGIC